MGISLGACIGDVKSRSGSVRSTLLTNCPCAVLQTVVSLAACTQRVVVDFNRQPKWPGECHSARTPKAARVRAVEDSKTNIAALEAAQSATS